VDAALDGLVFDPSGIGSSSVNVSVTDLAPGGISTSAVISLEVAGMSLNLDPPDPTPDPDPDPTPAPEVDDLSPPDLPTLPNPDPQPLPGSDLDEPPEADRSALGSSGAFELAALDLSEMRERDRSDREERFDPLRPSYLQPEFLQTLDQLRRDVLEEAESDAEEGEWFVPALQSIALAASTGIVAGLLRASSLVAMAISSVPFWRRTDPLMILSLSEDERRDLEANLREAGTRERDLDEILAGHPQPHEGTEEEDPEE
jgi:hypothetical protein